MSIDKVHGNSNLCRMRNVTQSIRNTSGVAILLYVMLFVFSAQRIIDVLTGYFLEQDFALSLLGLRSGKVWQLVSYAFLHEGILHLLFNGLVLLFIGKSIERSYGKRRLMEVFFISSVVSACVWMCIHFKHPYFLLLGASGGVLGLFSYFCMSCKNQKITVLLFFLFPITAKPKTILICSFLLELFYCCTQEMYGARIASSAHMGGMLGGVACYGIFQYLYRRRQPMCKKNRGRFYREDIEEESPDNYRIYVGRDAEEKQEVERILSKINEFGFASLTEEEKDTLNNSKHMMYR